MACYFIHTFSKKFITIQIKGSPKLNCILEIGIVKIFRISIDLYSGFIIFINFINRFHSIPFIIIICSCTFIIEILI